MRGTIHDIQLKLCRTDCKFYQQGTVFEECTTEESRYLDNNGKPQWHTIGHMRMNECGENGKLCRKPR